MNLVDYGMFWVRVKLEIIYLQKALMIQHGLRGVTIHKRG